MKHFFIMTVDLDPPISTVPSFVIERGATLLLNLFDEYRLRSTFFVPSIVAEKFPSTMKEVVERKHEVACHGLRHDPLEATLNAGKQTRMIKTATETIEHITGS